MMRKTVKITLIILFAIGILSCGVFLVVSERPYINSVVVALIFLQLFFIGEVINKK
jgi:hypothetical protein